MMSKLLKLKEWVTTSDAAVHLSKVLQENVTRADVLRLGLDGHLRLAVNFVNSVKARYGTVVPLVDAKYRTVPKHIVDRLQIAGIERNVVKLEGVQIDANNVLELDDEITTLQGVYDLPLIGTERLDIEHQYQQLTGGPAVALNCLEGPFVNGENGRLCQIQESFALNEFVSGPRAALDALDTRVARDAPQPEEADRLKEQHAKSRRDFFKREERRYDITRYYPAPTLPVDSVIVVRITALTKLLQRLEPDDVSHEVSLDQREENTLLRIIGALVELMLETTSLGKKMSVFDNQSSIIDALLARHPDKRGMSKRTLDQKIPLARKRLKDK
jgi:hypothetical protein